MAAVAELRDEISPALVRRLGGLLAGAWPAFPEACFARRASAGLGPLALMARVDHVAAALGTCLPDDFGEAAAVMEGALASPELDGWIALPCTAWVATAGIDDPATALPLLAGLTPRFSAEFAIRPFIGRHPEATWAQLRAWTGDPDEHVRRLVSEGTRPRLPWASRLPELIADPSPAVALLHLLADDESADVRRSVGNHLNDIAKDHPALAVDLARGWLAASTHGDEVARRGLRTLVAAGDPAALDALGLASPVRVERFEVTPGRVPLGGSVEVAATLAGDPGTPVVAHLLVHYRGAGRPPKPFVFARGAIPAGGRLTVRRRHAFRTVSIRTVRPGPHPVALQANGAVLARADVEVTPAPSADQSSGAISP
jgi:3-methyladenine DNA glycosylase AlkC